MVASRRDVLRAGVGLWAGSMAGCLDFLPFVGGPPPYARWMYGPGAVEPLDTFTATARRPARTAKFDDDLPDGYLDALTYGVIERFGFDRSSLDWVVSVQIEHHALVGSFTKGAAADKLRSAGFERDGNYRGFDVFADERSRAAIRKGELVLGGGANAGRAMRAMVDGRKDGSKRHYRSSESFSLLVDRIGTPAWGSLNSYPPTPRSDPEQGVFAGAVASGEAVELGERRSQRRRVVVFREGTDVRTDPFRTWVEASRNGDDEFSDAENVQIDRKGRTVVVTAAVPTGKLG